LINLSVLKFHVRLVSVTMARPRVADGGDGLHMEHSCEYMEQAVADSRHGVVLQLVV